MDIDLTHLILASKEAEKQEIALCKGKVYRVCESKFMRKNGTVVIQREYRFMKRLSCTGCQMCDYFEDDLREFEYKVIEGGNDGDLVELKMTNVTLDWESGFVDGYDLAFVVKK